MFAVEHVVIGNDLAGVGGHATHRGDHAGFDTALDFVVFFVLTNCLEQVIPFELIWIGFWLRKCPEQICPAYVVTFEGSASSWGMRRAGNNGDPFRTMCIAGKFIMASHDIAAIHEELGSVGKSVFD